VSSGIAANFLFFARIRQPVVDRKPGSRSFRVANAIEGVAQAHLLALTRSPASDTQAAAPLYGRPPPPTKSTKRNFGSCRCGSSVPGLTNSNSSIIDQNGYVAEFFTREKMVSGSDIYFNGLAGGDGGAGGIRTLDRALQPYNGLANRRLQPLGHSSVVVCQGLSSKDRWLKSRNATGLPP
jgi:hypothetical protein